MPKITYKNGRNGIKRNNGALFSDCSSVEDLQSAFENSVKALTDAGQIQEVLNAYNAKLAELNNVTQNAQANPDVGMNVDPEIPEILAPAENTLVEAPQSIDVTPTSSSIADEAIITQYNRLTNANGVKSNTASGNNQRSIIAHRETFRCLGFNG